MSLRLKLALVLLVGLLLPALGAVEARLAAEGELASAMDGVLVLVAITLVVLLTLVAGDVVRWAVWRTGRLTGSSRTATDVRADVESARPRS